MSGVAGGCLVVTAVSSPPGGAGNEGHAPAAPLRVEIGVFAEPSVELAAAWDALAARAAEPNPFSERWFAMPALRHLSAGKAVFRLEVWQDTQQGAELVALMLLTQAQRYGRLPVQHVTNWLHYQCFMGAPLIAAGWERQAWEAALDALAAAPWARGFLHFAELAEHGPVHCGLIAAADRHCDTVYRIERAFLQSPLSPAEYYAQTVRKKKRKEIGRLSARLAEQGTVETRRLGPDDALEPWVDAFLLLEQAGWKGDRGAALANTPATEAFFRDIARGAHAAGKLEMLRIDLDGRPIAMLVNFLTPPGSFSFKIAFDEGFARFSPGVLIEIENYQILARPDIAWMDSCAVEDHPMINAMWGQRRAVVRVTVPFSGGRSAWMFRFCRAAERAAAFVRRTLGQGKKAKGTEGIKDE